MASQTLAREGALWNLQCVIGEDYRKFIPYQDANGNPIDMTGWTSLAMSIRPGAGEAISISPTVTVQSPATAGILLINLSRATTLTMSRGTYVYNLMYKDSSGYEHELIYGSFIVIGPLTVA